MYDIIGDIHGFADELEDLLQKLGYIKQSGVYRHPNRQAIFLGDFIDRGPKVREVLQIVRPMVDSGSALAVMGNHEFNFLCYNHTIADGKWLRKHSIDNQNQVAETVRAFEAFPAELEDYMQWFFTLPVFLELDDFRVVHACWKPEAIRTLRSSLVNDRLTKDLLEEAGTKGTDLYQAVETILKGMEVPVDNAFKDTDGKMRTEARVRWWLNPKGLTEREYIFQASGNNPIASELDSNWFYPEIEKPVFIGHYWMVGNPELASANVCCVDYSIGRKTKEKEAKLVTYRWDSAPLKADNMIHVK